MVSNDSDRPIIGISTYVEHAHWGVWQRDATLLPRVYPDALFRAGSVPVLLPPALGQANRVLDALDGLVVSGGPDVDPARYAAARDPRTDNRPPERDDWELELIQAALDRDLPLLAICRGAQVLNVATGGTLNQHQPDQVGHERHRPTPGVYGRTRVRLADHSLAASVLGSVTTVDCHHHQAFDQVGYGLHVVGWADDGGIEAVELPGWRFTLGVQWHPEESADHVRLFTALVAACVAGARTDALAASRSAYP